MEQNISGLDRKALARADELLHQFELALLDMHKTTVKSYKSVVESRELMARLDKLLKAAEK